MYAHVRLLNGFSQLLTYKIPDSWSNCDLQGSLVKVPLQKRTELAYIVSVESVLKQEITFTLKELLTIELFPQDPDYQRYLKQLSHYYALEPIYFYKRLKHFLQAPLTDEPLLIDSAPPVAHNVSLTAAQLDVVESLEPYITAPSFFPALLHGVTGSGKTEIYKRLLLSAFAQHKSALFLLPEVSLAVQFYQIFKKQLPEIQAIFGFHSALGAKEKRSLWQHLLKGEPCIIVGVHLPLYLPIANLGLIIVDEEHDIGYQEKKHPKINTKEAALIRAQTSAIPIVLGSATPSVASLYNVEHKGWHFFELKERFSGAFPQVTLVKLTKKEKRKHFWLSTALEHAIAHRLARKEQTIIFINRRGFSFFIQCKECGFIATCTNCSVSLTLHEDLTLRCHYCGFQAACPVTCPACRAPEESLLKRGIGTQQVVTLLKKIYPQAIIERADMDTTVHKKKWTQIMQAMSSGKIDILVGTQTITKGYHFPRVTLVGILWADINLHFPVYHAAETTLQQLIQVAGRAGRQSPTSQVIVQHMLDHPIFNFIEETQWRDFYTQEINKRIEVAYPPCLRLAEIELKNDDSIIVEAEAQSLFDYLHDLVQTQNLNVLLLGPAQPTVHMIKKAHLRKIYLKSPSIKSLLQIAHCLKEIKLQSLISYTPNPLS